MSNQKSKDTVTNWCDLNINARLFCESTLQHDNSLTLGPREVADQVLTHLSLIPKVLAVFHSIAVCEECASTHCTAVDGVHYCDRCDHVAFERTVAVFASEGS